MSHPFTRVVFRVGDDDAKRLAEGFSYFEVKDLRNLEAGQAIARVERSDFDFNLSIPLPVEPDKDEAIARRREVITVSRNKYGTARAEVEAMLAKSRATSSANEPPIGGRAQAPSPSVKPTAFTPQPKPPRVAEVPPPSPPIIIPQASEPPKISEVPKPKEQPVSTVKHEPPGDLGRGGAQHQAIQKRIKELAEGLGFRSVIEKPVLDGHGSVDLWLERNGQNIACEISISTTIDHEVGNVAKCLKAGLPKVAVICSDEERLRKISKAVSGSLGAESAARVEYFQPDAFITYLNALKPPVPQPTETQYGGYKVKRSVPKLSALEQKQKEDIANRIMAETMRRT
jgi:hypothetical protein